MTVMSLMSKNFKYINNKDSHQVYIAKDIDKILRVSGSQIDVLILKKYLMCNKKN